MDEEVVGEEWGGGGREREMWIYIGGIFVVLGFGKIHFALSILYVSVGLTNGWMDRFVSGF